MAPNTNANPESSLNKDNTFIHNASSILVFLNFIWPKKPLTLKKHLWNHEQNSCTLMEKERPQIRKEKIHYISNIDISPTYYLSTHAVLTHKTTLDER
jgi:hypothetical protein